MSGHLLLISGPAGVGKTTLCNRLLEEFSSSLHRVITATSRKPRYSEVDGVDYFFFTEEEFLEKVKSQEFLEYEIIQGCYYGTLVKSLTNNLADKNLLLNIDVKGARSIQEKLPKYLNLSYLSVFIEPQSIRELEERLAIRGTDDAEEIKRRLTTAVQELEHSKRFDKVIKSYSKDEDYEKIRSEYLNLISQES